jgi:hypothetical protein
MPNIIQNTFENNQNMINPFMMSPMINAINNNMNLGYPNLDFNSEELGENIKVCIRIRPLNLTEQGRGDVKCVEYINQNSLNFKNKNIAKGLNYNIVFNEIINQEELFYQCSMNV